MHLETNLRISKYFVEFVYLSQYVGTYNSSCIQIKSEPTVPTGFSMNHYSNYYSLSKTSNSVTNPSITKMEKFHWPGISLLYILFARKGYWHLLNYISVFAFSGPSYKLTCISQDCNVFGKSNDELPSSYLQECIPDLTQYDNTDQKQ